ncbi:helix-turn-helix domain-containing protein [Sphingomonas sp. CA1-15]|uniref:Helix-turn-helix domain-containing protein n=1 Tax=Sphingomonas immobilis TaxID=3063997 RepID=A0ABT9A0P3_9SPHN|nr:helix-turn-helix domain-containing protein [Sphingomonas sp. CA1-15]
MAALSGELQTLKRGLEALAFINRNGPTNLATLTRHLELPRPNTYRLLQTLVAEGYCARIPHSRFYVVAPRVHRLSHGLQRDEMLTTVALPIVEALGKEIEWPVGLATPDGSEMVVRLATDISTPLALIKARPGLRSPMLMTTTGILYLASLPADARKDLLDAMQVSGVMDRVYSSRMLLDLDLESARDNGYLVKDAQFAEGSMGVPILVEGRFVGGLMMKYIRAGMPRQQAIDAFLPKLRRTAEAIAARFAATADWVSTMRTDDMPD